MKKLLTILAIVLFVVVPMAARDRVTTDVQELPSSARELITKYYAKVGVNHIKIDSKAFGRKEYDVILNNGTELDFNNDGDLKEIDCGRNAVPSGLVLKPIRDYVAKNFGGKKIVSMDIDSNSYEIELADGLDLKFDRSGKFLRIDD